MEQEKILNSLDKKARDCVIKDRRRGPDFLLKIINFLGYYVWAVLFIVMAVCERAGIKMSNIRVENRVGINISLLNVAVTLTIILFGVSVSLLFISTRRCRRRTDKIKTSLFVFEIISFVIGIVLLFKLYN